MATSLDRPQLRALLIDTLRTDGDFNAFVLDYFPDVHRNFTGGMDRTGKLNLLLESVDGDNILQALIKRKSALAAPLHITAASALAAPSVTPTPFEKPSPASIDPVSLPASLASMPPPKYVLHLSDLHFSYEHQADQWHTQLLLDLRNQMQIRELSAVVISGDITNHATVEQFGFAQNFLQQLCESFHIAKQRLIIVPGNHDVNWTLTDQGQDGFSPFAAFYQQLTGTAYPPSAADQTTLLHLADLKLLVLGLNTAWKIDRAHPSRAGLHAGAFGKALGSLLKNEEYQKCNKLAVWHHPPAELTSEAGLDGAVLEQLAQAGFRLILHGHIHRADNALFRYYRQSSVGGLEILTAGTFGAPTHELVSGYPFQYQVLEFRGDILTVHTRKRENVAGGWVADHRWQQAPGQSPLSSYQIALRTTQAQPGALNQPTPPVPGRPPQASDAASNARSSGLFADGAPIHWVDREKQTRHMQELLPMREHQLVLIPGPQGEAHELFLTRLERVIGTEHTRKTSWVVWPDRSSTPFPATTNGLLLYLAHAIGGQRATARDLPTLLANQLHDHDLLLLHPVVDRGFYEKSLLRYYTESIPKLLAELSVRHFVKLVQPISWHAEPSGLVAMFDRLRGKKSPKQEAYDFIYRLERQSAPLQVKKTMELERITKSDVVDFLGRYEYAKELSPAQRDEERSAFADKIIAGQATSKTILDRLAQLSDDSSDDIDDEEESN